MQDSNFDFAEQLIFGTKYSVLKFTAKIQTKIRLDLALT